jgi:hypothetical protein
MERDFKGVWIPAEIYLSPRLNWMEKILFVEILNHDDDGLGCIMTNKYFANLLNVSERTISKNIKSLCDLNLIFTVVEKNKNGTFRKIIFINFP